jgi:hypothetical protein
MFHGRRDYMYTRWDEPSSPNRRKMTRGEWIRPQYAKIVWVADGFDRPLRFHAVACGSFPCNERFFVLDISHRPRCITAFLREGWIHRGFHSRRTKNIYVYACVSLSLSYKPSDYVHDIRIIGLLKIIHENKCQPKQLNNVLYRHPGPRTVALYAL